MGKKATVSQFEVLRENLLMVKRGIDNRLDHIEDQLSVLVGTEQTIKATPTLEADVANVVMYLQWLNAPHLSPYDRETVRRNLNAYLRGTGVRVVDESGGGV